MRQISAGSFLMGSNDHYPEEAPARRVQVEAFLLDEAPVTNRAFAVFTEATGYRTVAERTEGHTVRGSAVFHQPPGPVPLDDPRRWWRLVPGADWRHPAGPGSTLADLEDHPVVHVAHEDACAYAAWAGKTLPTEAEWEYAARGGLDGAEFAWGDELHPRDTVAANHWIGVFPWSYLGPRHRPGTSAVGSYPANGYGLVDMIGNVWEWTASPATSPGTVACCGHAGGSEADMRVIKGGSHLCAAGYCERYRPAARQAQEAGSTSAHIGFRCAIRASA